MLRSHPLAWTHPSVWGRLWFRRRSHAACIVDGGGVCESTRQTSDSVSPSENTTNCIKSVLAETMKVKLRLKGNLVGGQTIRKCNCLLKVIFQQRLLQLNGLFYTFVDQKQPQS